MNAEQLKIKDPALFAEVIAIGEQQERSRAAKAMVLKSKPGISSRDTITAMIDAGIVSGRPYDDILTAATSMLEADLDSPGPIGTGRETTASGEPETAGARGSAASGGWKPGQIEEV